MPVGQSAAGGVVVVVVLGGAFAAGCGADGAHAPSTIDTVNTVEGASTRHTLLTRTPFRRQFPQEWVRRRCDGP
jgi:hypothetical protein